MVNQIYTIEHNQGNICKLFDHSDPLYQDFQILCEHYYYHKPHNINHGHLSEHWRLIQCVFGVCKLIDPDGAEIEFSRENKLQIVVPPQWLVKWENISGKAVVIVKECKKN